MSSWFLGPNARLSIPGQGSVHTELWARFQAGADAHHRATGVRTQVNSVMRSTAEQTYHWNRYQAYLAGGPWAPLAARPGTSNHEKGLAIDAQPAGRAADSHWQAFFRAAGLSFPVRGEPWHLELAPNRAPLPAPPPPAVPEEDIVANLDEVERLIDRKNKKLATDILGGLGNVTRIEAPVQSYRTPDGTITMVIDGHRVHPSPAQLDAARAAQLVPDRPAEVTAEQGRHLASLLPLRP